MFVSPHVVTASSMFCCSHSLAHCHSSVAGTAVLLSSSLDAGNVDAGQKRDWLDRCMPAGRCSTDVSAPSCRGELCCEKLCWSGPGCAAAPAPHCPRILLLEISLAPKTLEHLPVPSGGSGGPGPPRHSHSRPRPANSSRCHTLPLQDYTPPNELLPSHRYMICLNINAFHFTDRNSTISHQ